MHERLKCLRDFFALSHFEIITRLSATCGICCLYQILRTYLYARISQAPVQDLCQGRASLCLRCLDCIACGFGGLPFADRVFLFVRACR